MPNKLRNHRSANRVITDLDQNQPSILHKATPPENSSRIRRIIAIFVVAFAAIALYSIIILLYPPELEEDRLFYEKLDKFVQDNPGAKRLEFRRSILPEYDDELELRDVQTNLYGHKYIGFWNIRKNVEEGKGLQYLPGFSCIEGFFRNGHPDGYGNIIFNQGAIYQGQLKYSDSYMRDICTQIMPDGKCEEFNYDYVMNGKGKITFAEGIEYVGDFVYGSRSGYGTCNWSNGKKYQGNWLNGKQHGYGVIIWPNGAKYEGNWEFDAIVGYGTYTWPHGEKYRGNWVDEQKNGQGVFYYSDTENYEGSWKDDMRSGLGIYTNPNYTIEGNWIDDNLEGNATLKFPDGTQKQGIFRNGELLDIKEIAPQTSNYFSYSDLNLL